MSALGTEVTQEITVTFVITDMICHRCNVAYMRPVYNEYAKHVHRCSDNNCHTYDKYQVDYPHIVKKNATDGAKN